MMPKDNVVLQEGHMSNLAVSMGNRSLQSQIVQFGDLGHYLFIFSFWFGMYF